jgi:putative methanogenesis marker protein 6
MTKKRETFLVALSPDSTLTPSAIIQKTISFGLPVTIKETCFGILIEGEPEHLNEILSKVVKLDPNRIFIKARGFPIGDSRICRADRGGGPRLGYHQLDKEYKLLPLVSKALEKVSAKPEEVSKIKTEERKSKLHAEQLRKIIEKMNTR